MTDGAEIRVRFAPSPTGYWHPGNARTALFAWLYARHTGGTFVLRIEDTDQERNTPDALRYLMEGMRWLGMDWDEGPEAGGEYGPYLQSERLDLYRAAAERLLASGHAYYCFATPEELAEMREAQKARGIAAPKYDGRGRDVPPDEARARVEAGERHVLRFRLPEPRPIVVDDLVKGAVTFSSEDFDDFVIVKGDGFPVYNFACVVDDALMRINPVIRAEDHLSNTPKQMLLYEALGYEMPRFCHVPLIFNQKRAKLSKRDPGVVSVLGYRDQGILPEAVVNHLALMGWNPGDERDIFTPAELVEAFTLERVNSSPAVFDVAKLEHLGAEHLRRKDTPSLVEAAIPFFAELGLCDAPPSPDQRARLEAATDVVKSRAWSLKHLAETSAYLIKDDYPFDSAAVRKRLLKDADTPAVLEHLADALAGSPEWTVENVEAAFRAACEERGYHAGNAIHAARVAVSGQASGPGVFDVLHAVGQERTPARLRQVAERIRAGGFADPA